MEKLTEKELYRRQLNGYRITEELRVKELKNRTHEQWVRDLDTLWSVVREPQGDFFTTAQEVQQALDKVGLRNAIIGGVAVQRWGECRFTKDVDGIVECPLGQEKDVLQKLLSVIESRDPEPEHLALYSRMFLGVWTNGIQIDLSLGASGFEKDLLDRAVDVDFGNGRTLRCCTAEDLLIMKTLAGRDRDWGDVRTIIQKSGPEMDWEMVYDYLEPILDLAEKPEALDKLKKIQAQDGLEDRSSWG